MNLGIRMIGCFVFMALFNSVANGQNITRAEYFIDADPGYGSATAVTVALPGGDLGLQFSLPTGTLANGWHSVGIRGMTSNGQWGITCNRLMYIMKLPSSENVVISKAEYFIDTDPGYGNAFPMTVSDPGYELTIGAIADLSDLNPGFHHLCIRTADATNRWGSSMERMFYYAQRPVAGADINRAEYFIDTDPGYGNAKPFSLPASGTDLALDITDDLDGLPTGIHHLVIRAGDRQGSWGCSSIRSFYFIKTATAGDANITQLEYFYDTDPGFGKGITVSTINPARELSLSFDANLSGLVSGEHTVYVRAKNVHGQWGAVYAEAFSYTFTGISDYQVVSLFKVFPNPGRDQFRIEFNESHYTTYNLSISDVSGNIVFKNRITSDEKILNLNLQPGIYIIELNDGKNIATQKLIIY